MTPSPAQLSLLEQPVAAVRRSDPRTAKEASASEQVVIDLDAEQVER